MKRKRQRAYGRDSQGRILPLKRKKDWVSRALKASKKKEMQQDALRAAEIVRELADIFNKYKKL